MNAAKITANDCCLSIVSENDEIFVILFCNSSYHIRTFNDAIISTKAGSLKGSTN